MNSRFNFKENIDNANKSKLQKFADFVKRSIHRFNNNDHYKCDFAYPSQEIKFDIDAENWYLCLDFGTFALEAYIDLDEDELTASFPDIDPTSVPSRVKGFYENPFDINELFDALDYMTEEYGKKSMGIEESNGNSMNKYHALQILRESGMRVEKIDEKIDTGNRAQRSQIQFSLDPIKWIMMTDEEARSAREKIKRSVVSTIRRFPFPQDVDVQDLMFSFELKDSDEKDPYFVFDIWKKPGIESLFTKAFSADIEVNDDGECTSLKVPDGFLSLALIEFVDNI